MRLTSGLADCTIEGSESTMSLPPTAPMGPTAISYDATGQCPTINLMPVPPWFIAYLIGVVVHRITAMGLHHIAKHPRSPLSRGYNAMDAEKQKKWQIMVIKGTCSTLGFAVWAVMAVKVFQQWGDNPNTWLDEYWSTYFRWSGAILTTAFLFELCYNPTLGWDTWMHHVAAITMMVVVLCERSHSLDWGMFIAWATLYSWSTTFDQGIFWGMAVYYLAPSDVAGCRTKLIASRIVFMSLCLTVGAMNSMPLAFTIAHWKHFSEPLSKALLILCHVPFLPDHILSVRKVWQIMQHNLRRYHKALEAEAMTSNGGPSKAASSVAPELEVKVQMDRFAEKVGQKEQQKEPLEQADSLQCVRDIC